jgi:15-cis-phytoene synthase
MPAPAAQLEAADASLVKQAAEACAKGSKSFYFATKFFPPHLASAAHAVYWFCRHSDDMVDLASDPLEARRNLAAWREATQRAFQSKSEHPVLQAFSAVAHRHQIPLDLPLELLEGMRMDLDEFEYRTFDDLWLFCYRVASVVGLMMSHVIGFEAGHSLESARSYAVDLGVAMQLTFFATSEKIWTVAISICPWKNWLSLESAKRNSNFAEKMKRFCD